MIELRLTRDEVALAVSSLQTIAQLEGLGFADSDKDRAFLLLEKLQDVADELEF